MALPQDMTGDCRAFNFNHKYFITVTHIVHPDSPCFLHHSHVLYISFVLCSHCWVVRILHFHCRDLPSIKRLAPLQRPQSNELRSGFVMFKRFAIWKLLGQILTKWSQDDLCFHFLCPALWVKMNLMIYKASLGSADALGSCCGSGLPSQPSTVSPPAGWDPTGRLQDGKMAEQKAESACFSSLSSTANEGIDVASGTRPSFSQTTDTNWQHVSWFTNQTSTLDLETHEGICVGKRRMRDAAVIKYPLWTLRCLSLDWIKLTPFWASWKSHCYWSGFSVWSKSGNIHKFSLIFTYCHKEAIILRYCSHSVFIQNLLLQPLLGQLPVLISSCINHLPVDRCSTYSVWSLGYTMTGWLVVWWIW